MPNFDAGSTMKEGKGRGGFCRLFRRIQWIYINKIQREVSRPQFGTVILRTCGINGGHLMRERVYHYRRRGEASIAKRPSVLGYVVWV